MIIGVGLDIAEIDRVGKSLERFGTRFIQRILGPAERKSLPRMRQAQYVAVRFAAKEAAAKALGTGFALGIGFHDLEVVKKQSRKAGHSFSWSGAGTHAGHWWSQSSSQPDSCQGCSRCRGHYRKLKNIKNLTLKLRHP